jgi:hypothetical protein
MNTVKKPALGILAAFLGAGFSSAVASENQIPGRFSLSPSIGLYRTTQLGRLIPLSNTADVPGVEILLEPKSPEGGLSLGYRLGRRLELRAGASASRAGIIEDVGIGFAGIPLGKFEVSRAAAWSLSGGLVYYFGRRRLAPYFALGAGALMLATKKIGAKTRPLVEFGAGLNARLSRRLQAVFDVRDTVTFFRYFEDFRIATILIYRTESQKTQHRLGARLGLRYIFSLS